MPWNPAVHTHFLCVLEFLYSYAIYAMQAEDGSKKNKQIIDENFLFFMIIIVFDFFVCLF